MTRFTPSWRQAEQARTSSCKNPRQQWRGDRLGRTVFITFASCIVIFGASLAIVAAGNPGPKFPPCGKVAAGQVSKQGCYNACTAGCRNQMERNLCFRACDQKFDGEGQ